MPNREALKKAIASLKQELGSGRPLDAEHRSTLETLLDEVAPLLDEPASSEHDHETTAERLREAAKRFEDSHPDLTMAVGAVADILSRLGI